MKVELNGVLATVRDDRRETLVNVPVLANLICANATVLPSIAERAALAVGYLDANAKLGLLQAELQLLREACDVGAVLSRRIKDGHGRIRHADQIVDDMLKLIGGA